MQRQNIAKRSSVERSRRALAAAAVVTVERLEQRSLFSGMPTVTIAGPASVTEGSNYPLTLSTANLLTPVDHWTVNWGDTQTTVPGTAAEADHVYPDGPHSYAITATATLTSGIVLTANGVGAGVTNPGTPDPAFGTVGQVVNAQGGAVSNATSVATLDDGQFVVAGSVGSGANNVLQRYNADGSLDTTFANGGTLVVPNATNIGAVLDEHVADPAHPGYELERLLVVGSVDQNRGYTCHSTLWRFDLGQSAAGTPDGTPDAAFGTNGVVTLPFQLSGTNYEGDNAFAATIAPSGQIVVEGLAWLGGGFEQGGEYLAVSRLNPNGTLDTTFNGTGQQAIAVGNSAVALVGGQLTPVGVVSTADGSVVAMADGGGLVKLNNAGQPDPHFGTGGVAIESAGVYPTVVTYDDMTLDSTGNLLLGGVIGSNGNYGWALGRYNYTTGAVDPNYGVGDAGDTLNLTGVDGRFTSHNADAGLLSLTTLASGQVVAEGWQTPTYNGTGLDLTVGRFAPNGTPDTSFVTAGLALVSLGGNVNSVAGVSVQPDGKLVAAATFVPSGGVPAWTAVRFGQTVAGTVTPLPVSVANVPPTPTINAPVTAGLEGTAITLAGSATDPSPADTAAGLALAWSVTKNGNAFASGSGGSFTFTPDDNGTYVVTLKATDKDGGVGTATDTIAVANVAPTPTVTAPVTAGLEGTAISLAGSATDPSPVDTAAGLPLTWAVTKNGNPFAGGSGASFTFTPNDNGTYVVTLSATDKDGGVGTTTDTVAVANVAPTPAITAPVTAGLEGSAVTLSGSATDPSPVDTAAGLPLAWSVTKNGTAFVSGSGASFTFTPNDNGTYVVTLSATDKDGGVGTTTDTVAVANVAPTPTITVPVTAGLEGTAITLAGSATDPSPVDTAAGLPLAWSATKNGTAFASGSGASFTFTPDDNGTYVVTLKATDKDGGVGSTTDTVAVANVAPTAAIPAPVTTGNEGSPITLVGTATDPSPVDTAAGLARAWAVTKNGSPFATGSGGTLTFTPDDNGTYVATFTAADKDGGVGTATDTVAVANVAPTPTIASPAAQGYAGVAVALTGSVTDPSPVDTAAGLTLAWSTTKNGAAFGSSGSGGSYSFTPDTTGAYVVTLRATDKDGGTSTTTDSVNVIPAGYRLTAGNLMYNAITEATGVASFALRNDGNAYYLTTAKSFDLNQYASGQTTSFGQVYSYGLRADGWAYYWSQADNKLYINQSTYNVPVDNNPVLGFGMRSDGYGYYWDGTSKILYLNTTSQNIPVDNNPLSGFGVRADGSAYFWDSVSHVLQVNTVYANYQIGGDPIQGFGLRSDGSAFFWDANNGILYVNLVTGSSTGSNVQVSSGTVSAFASDSNGNGFFAPANAPGTLHRNTVAADTLLTSAYIANSLASTGPGPVTTVTYSAMINGVTTRVIGS